LAVGACVVYRAQLAVVLFPPLEQLSGWIKAQRPAVAVSACAALLALLVLLGLPVTVRARPGR
jgi:uncharacterized membrane protein YdjX (TVP38/TMEM64 family)